MEPLIYERYFQEVTRREFHQSSLLLQYARERQTTPHMLWLDFTQHIQMYRLQNTLANLIEYLSVTGRRNDANVANYAWSNNTNVNYTGSYGSVDASSGFDARYGNGDEVLSHGFDVIASKANNQHSFDVNNSSNSQRFDIVNSGSIYFDAANNSVFNINEDVVFAKNVNNLNANLTAGYQNVNVTEVFNSSVEEVKVVFKKFVRPKAYTHADFLKVKKEAEEVFAKVLLEEERRKAEEEKKNEVLRNIHEMLK